MNGHCTECNRNIGKLPTHCVECGKYYRLPEKQEGCAAGEHPESDRDVHVVGHLTGEWRDDVEYAPLGKLVLCRWHDGSWDKAMRIQPEKYHNLTWCNEKGAMLVTPYAYAIPSLPPVKP